ncbi:sodium:calcium antiporter [Xylanimonas protaetiae]|uniref:sodium:calcium antiporter n=1 Tax=Xylanimonas protaetiae TaxID=2509457 RepID=UPI001A9289C1|nr:hypothetical protein [Xylanimonas protaetiae]
MTILMLLGGLAALIAGAEIIVNFGTRLARMLGISPLIIGLTIVSIGTSAPELAVGIDAMRRDAGSLVLGNIAGTNLVNLLLILGLSAAIRPITLQRQTFRLDLPAMVGSSILLLLLSLDGGSPPSTVPCCWRSRSSTRACCCARPAARPARSGSPPRWTTRTTSRRARWRAAGSASRATSA